MKERIKSLDFLRGLAIIFTILGHWIGYSDHPGEWTRLASRILPNGYFGVRLFFLISGYIITKIFLSEIRKREKIDVKLFYLKRVIRILPVYFIYLTALFFVNEYLSLGLTKNDFLFPSLFLVCFYHNLDWVVLHFWSLNVEEWFYIVYPFLLVFFLRVKSLSKFKSQISISLIILTVVPYVLVLIYPTSEKFLFRNLIYISVGVYCALYNENIKMFIRKMPKNLLLFVFGATLILYAVFNPHFEDSFSRAAWTDVSTLLATTLVFISFMFVESETKNKMVRSKFGKVISYLGLACYSLYIWQELFLRTSNDMINQFPLNIILVFVVGLASFEVVEKFFEKIKSKMVTSRINKRID